jgi:hypothetical protein
MSTTGSPPRRNRVVPFAVKIMGFDSHLSELLVTDFDLGGVLIGFQGSPDCKRRSKSAASVAPV